MLSLPALSDIAAEGVMVAVSSRTEPEAGFVLGAAKHGEVRRSGHLPLGRLATPRRRYRQLLLPLEPRVTRRRWHLRVPTLGGSPIHDGAG